MRDADDGASGGRGSDFETDAEEGEEWRFGVEEVGSDAGASALEPGSPDPENVAFFLLGVAFAVGVLVSLAV